MPEADVISRRKRLSLDQLVDIICVASPSLRADLWLERRNYMGLAPKIATGAICARVSHLLDEGGRALPEGDGELGNILWTLERGRMAGDSRVRALVSHVRTHCHVEWFFDAPSLPSSTRLLTRLAA